MSEGKIKFHEALGYKAERDGDYAEMHTQFQQAEYYKRKDNDQEQRHTKKLDQSGGRRTKRGVRRNAYDAGNQHENTGKIEDSVPDKG